MKILPRIFLSLAVATFLASLTEAGSGLLYGALKPFSALLFIAGFISNLLGREMAEYDAEFAGRMASARARSQRTAPAKPRARSVTRASIESTADAALTYRS